MMPLFETGAIDGTGSLIAAAVIGVAFGWCLERAGLGSARKLAGQFYLTDTTVFKVMFSALVTAMLGAFWLDRFGLLDLGLVYVPETFVLPQATGGVLFGAGFLIAGLCPGTSCVAAAAGRRDGLAVIGGMFGGILLFNVAYPQLATFYSSTALGSVRLDHLAGTTQGAMVGAITAAALAAFAIAGRPFMLRRERDTNARHASPIIRRSLASIAATLALAAVVASPHNVDASAIADEIEAERDHISAPELAGLIVDGVPGLRVFDVRSAEEYRRMHVPGARHATLEDLSREPLPRDSTIVLYSEGGSHAAQAWVLLRMRGYRRVYFLREGLYEWLARVMEPRLAIDATPAEREEFVRAAELSRFFGGLAREGVPRSEVPTGYWTTSKSEDQHEERDGARDRTRSMIAGIRRRGC